MLQFDHWRPRNKELLELGLELGSLLKKRVFQLFFVCFHLPVACPLTQITFSTGLIVQESLSRKHQLYALSFDNMKNGRIK